MMPRLMSDQKPSIVFVWIAPTTYSPFVCSMIADGNSLQILW